MARRLFLLLIATLALGSGVYALRTKKSAKRPVAAIPTHAPALNLGSSTLEASPSKTYPIADSLTLSKATALSSRISLLLVVAVVLATGAYQALGNGSEIANAAQYSQANKADSVSTPASSSRRNPFLEDDLRSLRANFGQLAPPAAPTPAPATPAPTVAAEASTPAPTPRPAPPIPPDGIEGIICALPWPCQEAIAVAACESGRDRYGRLDGSSDTNGNHYGVFQISSIHAWRWPDFWESWMDPTKNAQWAYEIWAEQGWKPWSCRWAIYG